MNRRQFLGLGALGAVSLSAPVLSACHRRRPTKDVTAARRQVVVIGAGLAGLCAAYELARAGRDVVVLEAQERVGGRVQTWRSPFDDGLHAEAGAARIPADHEWTLRYIKRFNLPLTPFYPKDKDYTFYMRGKRIRKAFGETPDLSEYPIELSDEERALASQWVPKLFGPLFAQSGDPMAPDWPPAPLRKYDELSVAELLHQAGLSDDAFAAIAIGIASPSDAPLSVLWLLQSMLMNPPGAERLAIVGGSDRLPRAFASELGERIRHGVRVTGMEQNKTEVRVHYSAQGTEQTITAEHVICTLPFTVLRDIPIDPLFSAGKQNVIRELRYATPTRVAVQMKQRFWLEQGLNGFARTDHPGEVWHPTFDQPGPRGILEAYIREGSSQLMASMPTSGRLQHGIQIIDSVIPGVGAHAEQGIVKCWGEDRFARGGFIRPSPGQMLDLLAHGATSGATSARSHVRGSYSLCGRACLAVEWSHAGSPGIRASRGIRDHRCLGCLSGPRVYLFVRTKGLSGLTRICPN